MTFWSDALQSLAGGVLWIDPATRATNLLDELDESWRIVSVAVEIGASKESIIKDIGAALEFPDWAGQNLDALYDLLTDLSWLDVPNVVVALERTPEIARDGFDGWQQIVQILLDAAAWWQPDRRTFVAVLR